MISNPIRNSGSGGEGRQASQPRTGLHAGLLTGTALLLGLLFPPALAAQQGPSAPPAPPAAGQQPTSPTRPGEAQAPAEPTAPPEPSEVQPEGPVQPVRTFDPVPLPGELQQSAPAAAGAQPARPAAPVTLDASGSAILAPIVPGAAEAGYVVPDTRRLFGRDAVPEIGAAVVAAAGFRASAALQGSYESNVRRLPSDVAPPAGSGFSRSDWVLRPDLNLGLGRPLGQQLLFLNASLGRDFFLRNEQLNRNNINIVGGLDWKLGVSCSGRVQGGWNTRETGAEGFLLGVPGSVRSTDFFASATCNRGYGLVPSVTFSTGSGSFTPDVRTLFNVDYWSLGGSLGYQFGPSLQAGLQVVRQGSSFPNQPLDPLTDPDGETVSIRSLAVSGFASYAISSSLSANVALGWTNSSSNSPLISDFSGLTGNLSLAYSGPRYGIAVNAGRDVNLANVQGGNLRIRTRIGLTGDYRLTPDLTLGAGFAFNRDDNRGDPRFGAFPDLLEFEQWRAFASARYAMSDRLSFTLGYRYEARPDRSFTFVGPGDFLLPGFHSHVGLFGLRFGFL